MISNHALQNSCVKIFQQDSATSFARLAVLMMLLCLLTACVRQTNLTLEPNAGAVVIPGHADAPFSNASFAYLQGDFSRVMSEMDRTCLGTHWSLMTLDREPADHRQVTPSVPDLVIATALMPSGLKSEIYCWAAEDGRIAVAVRAGPFGNEAKEKRFLQSLAENLRKPAVPDRSRTFDMPTIEQYQQAHEPVYE